MSRFISHVGKHVQGVSHAAIPISAMTKDDEDLELSDTDNNTMVSRVFLSQYDTNTDDSQFLEVYHNHYQRSFDMDSHNYVHLREVPWLISCLYMASTETHAGHGQRNNQESSGQRSYSQVFSRRKRVLR